MSDKVISTKLVIEGEKETRAAISAINAEYRNLQAELKSIDSAFSGNQNSMDALCAKATTMSAAQDQLNQRLELQRELLEKARQAQEAGAKATENARAALEDARRELAEYKEYGDENVETLKEYAAAAQEAEKELTRCEQAQAAAGKTISNYSREVNLTQAELNDLNRAITENAKHQKEAQTSSNGCAVSIDEYGKAVKQAAEQTKELNEENQKLEQKSEVVKDLSVSLAAAKIPEGIQEIKDALVDCVEASVEFESAVTGVYKTIDADQGTLDRITEGIQELSLRIPATAVEIAAVAENAGQLGIAADDVLGFTEVMIQLGSATNVSAEEAASSLAKFANATGMPADNFDRLGASIAALGNNLATTESDVIAMGTNLASAGAQIGLTESEIMGMAAALSSVGMEADAGGTAISKLMIEMASAAETGGEEVEQFADVCGMTADEFVRAFGQDAANTLTRFFTGLGSSGQSAISILNEMGITETRLRDAMLRLSNASGTFEEAIQLSNAAWTENTALSDEAEKRYATTESKVQLLKNSFQALQVEIGNQVTPSLSIFAEAGQGVIEWATQVIQEMPWLVNVLEGVAVAAGAFVAGVSGFVILKTVIPLMQTFWATLTANPLGMVAASITAVVSALVAIGSAIAASANSWKEYAAEALEAQEALSELEQETNETIGSADAAVASAERYIDRLEELERQSERTKEEQAEYADLVERVQALLPDVNLSLDEQTGMLDGGTAALREQVDAWREAAVSEALYTQKKALLSRQANVLIEQTKNQNELNAIQAEKQAKLADAVQAITDVYDANGKALSEWGFEEWNAFLQSSDAAQGLQSAYWEARNAAEELTKEEEDLQKAIEEGNETLADYEWKLAELDGVEETLLGTTDDLSDAQADMAAKFEESGAAITEQAETLRAAYEEAYAAAAEMAEKSSGLFDDMSERQSASLADMTANEQSRADFYTEYAAALTGALDAVPESMRESILSIADMSAESLAQLQAIANGSDEEIAAVASAFEATETAQKALAEAIAEAETNFTESKEEILKQAGELAEEMSQYDAMYAAGAESAQGYVDGLNSILSGLVYAPGSSAAPGSAGTNGGTGINVTVHQTFDSTATQSEVKARSQAAIEAALQ